MNWLSAVRLLLDVYGALFLGLVGIAAISYGVFPYEALMRVGTLVFYALFFGAFALWIALVAMRIKQHREEGD